MKAEEIKKAIIEKKIQKSKPAGEAEILGVRGCLFRSSSALIEDWRLYANAETDEGKPDYARRRLAPAKLVQISFRDEQGNYVFEDSDVPVIGGIDNIEIMPVTVKILNINGLSRETHEQILKNLIAIVGVAGLYDLLASINAPCPRCSSGSMPESS